MNEKLYEGLDEDLKKGLGPTAKIVLDARVFGLIPKEETCKGWRVAGIQSLYDKVSNAWEPYGHLPSRLPDDLRARHSALFEEATRIAKENGWNPDGDLLNEH